MAGESGPMRSFSGRLRLAAPRCTKAGRKVRCAEDAPERRQKEKAFVGGVGVLPDQEAGALDVVRIAETDEQAIAINFVDIANLAASLWKGQVGPQQRSSRIKCEHVRLVFAKV